INQNDTATARCARRSEVGDAFRDPVKRHTTMTLATPSITEPNAQPVRETEPARTPAISPMTPSAVIHTRLAQARRRAQRAADSQGVFGNWALDDEAAQLDATTSRPERGVDISEPRL